jgi:hypothetical protein
VRPGGGAAPDAMKIGDRYLVVYGATGGSGNHKGAILTMWNKTWIPNLLTLSILNRWWWPHLTGMKKMMPLILAFC